MPLIKVSSQDNKVSILILANDLSSLKQKVEKKLGYKIDKFIRKQDEFEIDDDDVLLELINTEKDLWLIAVSNSMKSALTCINESLVKVSRFDSNKPILISATSLDILRIKAERELDIEIEKIVRKSDGVEIDENEIFLELKKSDKNLWLVALQADEEFIQGAFSFENYESELKNKEKKKLKEDEDDEANYFYDECPELESKMRALSEDFKSKAYLQEDQTATSTKIKTEFASKMILKTAEIEQKKKELEQQIKKQDLEKKEKLKKLEELSRLNTTFQNEQIELKELEKKYREKLFTDQVTKQASKTELHKAEARLIELDLKKKKISNIFCDLKLAEKVDICFLIDCTGSMQSYIDESKTVMHKIVDKLQKRFQNFELRASFIGYRDHSDAERVVTFNFTEKIDSFKSFVSKVDATGGADQCEDVFGGLEEVNKLDWSNMSRILFHIADAPCHGSRFHSDCGDDYPSGDPRGLDITNLLKQIVSKNIFYYFAEINKSTLKMIEEFDKELLALNGNKINVVSLSSVDGLTEIVTKSVIKTISESKSMSMHSSHGKSIKNIKVEPESLSWSLSSMKKHKADYYTAKYNGDISEIKTKSIDFEKKSIEIYVAEKPFAKGALRFAYAAVLNGKNYVVKQSMFREPDYNTMKYHKEMIENQVISSFLAKQFFEILKAEKFVKFIDVHLVHLVSEGLYFSIEEFIEGDFVKWMNNCGIINEDIYSCTLDAFSHWSYQVTDEYLIVTDLQGMIVNNKDYILTDPAISSPEGHDRFSTTNLGTKGVKKFFETHQCNHICKHLKLKKHPYQALPDRKMSAMMTKVL